MNENLIEAIARCVMFLETSDEDLVDPDAACDLLEQVSGLLGAIHGDGRLELVATLKKLAERETSPRGRESLAALIEYLGDSP